MCYSYPGSSKDTLHGINLRIQKGDKLAIVGENGAGKTTFIKLLLRLYTPTKGCILLNGIDYREYDINDYYELFSTVFQDYMVFAYTLRENIVFDDAADKENSGKLNTVMDKLELQKIADKLPFGLDTYITQNYDMSGVGLSGGESQRMAIARAWYKNAPVVVMDEPTSAIDPLSEERLFNRIEEFMEDKTVVLISHRLSSVRLCNKIIFFMKGGISEIGTHEELMDKKMDYCRMYEAQAQWYR